MSPARLFPDKPVGDVYGRVVTATHGLHVVLWQPEIPQNTGSIGRLCVGGGATLHLIHPLGFRTDATALKRAGLDYWENLAVEEHADFDAFLLAHPEARGRLWMSTAKAGVPYPAARYEHGDFLMFGPETRGLPREWLTADPSRCITIPILGPVRSFNLANAVSIVLYEAIRQLQPEVFT